MSGLQVSHFTLRDAADEWDAVADGLDGAWRRLHDASVSSLEPDVASAVETFRETWVDAVKTSATSAQDHAESLQDAADSYATIDDAAFQALQGLLPWEYRDATLFRPPPGPAGP